MRTTEAIKAEIATLDAEYAVSAKRAKYYDRVVNEGGEGYSTLEELSHAHYLAGKKLRDELFAAEWTLEVLTERRKIWNEEVQKSKPKTHADKCDIEDRLGFSFDALKRAKEMHGVK